MIKHTYLCIVHNHKDGITNKLSLGFTLECRSTGGEKNTIVYIVVHGKLLYGFGIVVL